MSSSVWYLVAINSAVAGLEIAVCIAFTFIPTLLLKSGYSDTQMTIILGVAPCLAMFTVPELGRWSDNCTSTLGRRRPFLLGMSILLIFSLVLLYFGQSGSVGTWKALMLGAGVILLDYSTQAAINPCEALVSDVIAQDTCKSSNDCEYGFTVYSGMLSVGACLGYLIIALDLEQLGIVLGNREQTAFAMCIILYSICVFITFVVAKEKQFIPRGVSQLNPECSVDPGYVSDEDDLSMSSSQFGKRAIYEGLSVLGRRTYISLNNVTMRHLMKLSPLNILRTICTFIKHLIALPLSYYYTICTAPPILRQLYFADLASWISVMAHAMFYTEFAAVVVYGGRPDAPSGSVYDHLFDEGVRMGSWGLLLHSITGGVYAVFVQEHVASYLGLKESYKLGLIIHSVAMAATVLLSSNIICLNLAAAASGVGYAVVTTIPNTLVTVYHEDTKLYYGSATSGGVGESLAILDSGYYLSQILLSLIMGHIVELTGLPHCYIIASCVAGVVAVFLSDKVVFKPADLTM